MIYAKLINNQLQFAPRKLPVGEFVVYNPTTEMLTEAGYKPVIYTDPPETEPGYLAVPGWEETEEAIVQTWTVELAPITEDKALVRYANELTGQQDETLEEATETLIKMKMEE